VLGRLLDRHADALLLYARQWCDPAEDVVQDAFVKLSARRTPPDDRAA
jgi:DNA-directed RNA polymerase specialized sigma24 family protein